MDFIIDTNMIFGDHFLKNPMLENFCKEARKWGHKVYIPEVVLEEHNKHYKECLEEHQAKAGRELKEFSRLAEPVDNPITSYLISKNVRTHNDQIRDRAKDLHMHILPAPAITHRSLAKKAIYRIKPFTPAGAGYIDALIWETVKDKCDPYSGYEHLAYSRVVLLSKDGDFSKPKSLDLHDDLIDELVLEGIDPVVVQILADFPSAIKACACTDDELTLKEAQTYFAGSGLTKSAVIKEAKKRLVNLVPDQSVNNEEIDLGDMFESPTINGLADENFVFEMDSIELINTDTLWVRLNVSTNLLLDVCIYKSDYYLMDDDSGIHVHDKDWNDHYVAAEMEKEVWFTLDIEISVKDYSIEKLDIEVNADKNVVAFAA